MKRFVVFIVALLILVFFTSHVKAQQYITLGVPTSLKLIEGYEGHKAAQLAAEEINAKGGVKVGTEKKLLKIEALLAKI